MEQNDIKPTLAKIMMSQEVTKYIQIGEKKKILVEILHYGDQKKRKSRNCPLVQWLTSPSRLENSSNFKYPFKTPRGCGFSYRCLLMCPVD